MSEIQRHLRAAIGFIELGMLEDAVSELESLPPEDRDRSSVLALRVEIYRTAGSWSLMEVAARELWKRHPDEPVYWINLAWAVRRLDSLVAARDFLLEAVDRFPGDAMTHFNLGCYACQLGDIEQAKTRVGKAIELDAKFKLLALDDADLEPLWKQIGGSKNF
jgi:tetratricopeptide (TPR) repeat protein